MKIIELQPDNMADVIKNIAEQKKNDVFVFSTDVVLNSWTDWIITNTNVTAVALDNFKAWDNFKEMFISEHNTNNATVIPSILRKMFVTDMIAKNADENLSEEQKFHHIINPDYAKEATFNGDWLCDTLRSLHFWKKRFDDFIAKNPDWEPDMEDRDYEMLYDKYKAFLDNHNLFEPSWIDDIEFTDKERNFHIFYPELLEDFADYGDLFEKLPNIFIYRLPEEGLEESRPKAYLYPDSRKELRQTMLSIINIVQKSEGATDWSEIALSIPDIETYRPYIQREFELYGIPYVIKAGVSLTKNAAGRIFREIQDCYSSNFSYDSVRTLLLDEYMPWTDDVNLNKEALIKEGNRMRCICSAINKKWMSKFGEKDIWEVTFDKKIEKMLRDLEKSGKGEYLNIKLTGTLYENPASFRYNGNADSDENVKISQEEMKLEYFINLKKFYEEFKLGILNFFKENTFENIRKSWMAFKEKFFDNEKFTEDENNILSRCIVTLNQIIDIEKQYNGLLNLSPYNFFLQELDNETYTKQTNETGVNIFPYKLSAAAYFKYQFVIDSSQKNIDVSYKRLAYLSDKKRDALLTEKEKLTNASDVFIRLYGKTTEVCDKDFVHFSGATDSFGGFAIPHNSVKIIEKTVIKDGHEKNVPLYPDFDKDDYILQEKNIIKSPDNFSDNNFSSSECAGKVRLLKSQIESYNNWKQTAIQDDENYEINDKILQAIDRTLKISRNSKPEISARGTLENFFPCPRKWMLKKVLKVEEESLDTNLMNNYDMGNINHKILQLFMNKYKAENKALPYYDKKSGLFKYKTGNQICDNDKICEDEINNILYGKGNIIEKAITDSRIKDFEDSPLAIEALYSQKKKAASKIKDFLKVLLLPYGESPKKDSINGIGTCIVVEAEKELSCESETFKYKGSIDSFFQSNDDEKDLIIIDYKNTASSIPNAKDIHVNEDNILGHFQLPVYYKLIKDNYKDKNIAAGYFYSVSVKKDKESESKRRATDKFYAEKNNNKENDLDFSDTIGALDQYSQIFIDKINSVKKSETAEEFSPYSTENDTDKLNVINYKHCKECPYKNICRTTYTIAGKELKSK